ncbi:ESCRT-II subunit protein VPS36 [Saccharomyces eubayanus]|uniref:ESCRT-II subunit protein VPS36 n=1 Tax=Saccharomyces eubayanus TaxID=1080349 RepID=UPI0006BF322B|nr:VPS36-like protein [Saccharomyces eubayanus]KOG98084.1 VPS36-like protein [Saccharomyces eubayanus]
MEYWHYVETTSSGQPLLRENETDIFIDQSVGLYHGKSKILQRQRGRVFLTSQRIIYIDDSKPTQNSLGLELDDLAHVDYSSGFLTRSPRLILFFKDSSSKDALEKRADAMCSNVVSTWVCPICMVSNETRGEFAKDTLPLPICVNCGVPADYELTRSSINSSNTTNTTSSDQSGSDSDKNVCSACTFVNHPQIGNCEICGHRLPNASKVRSKLNKLRSFHDSRIHIELEKHSLSKSKSSHSASSAAPSSSSSTATPTEFVQLSFRKSDGVLFSQATEKALEGILHEKNKHIFNQNVVSVNGIDVTETANGHDRDNDVLFVETKLSRIGIASLEKSRENQLLNNDILFNNALTDLNKLMSLATSIERLYKNSNIAMKKTTTNFQDESTVNEPKAKRPLLILDRDKFLNKELFLDEIAREIYEFTLSEFKDSNNDNNNTNYMIVTLVDLYAMYNKSMRIGTGLISPMEMKEACERFEHLGLNELRLVKVNKRILCLTSEKFDVVKEKLVDLINENPGSDLLKLTQILSSNNSQSNWTLGILMEVLQSCVDEGDLLIDKQLSGIYYYKNSYWPPHTQIMNA